MSKNILFISEQHLKDTSLLSDNVDPKQLLPTLKSAQDMYIHPMLGTGLYKKLQEMIEADTVAEPYKELLEDYITDCLVWYTMADMPITLQMKLVNKGVVTRSGESIQISSSADLSSLTSYCQTRAKWYAQRVIDYLCAHSKDFPEYVRPGSTSDTIHPDSTQFTCGIFLG